MRIVIEIVEHETHNVVKIIEGGESWERAEKVDDGVNINLDHCKFYTRIKEEKP